jgi:glycosyltransferase involved in cell wall biosynthesis
MKTITVLAYNRPDYLRVCLANLSRCRGIDGYEVIVSIDGGAPKETKDSAEYYRFQVDQLLGHYGIDTHNFCVYENLFMQAFEFNISLEDDVILSPDALELAEWFYNHPNRDSYAFLSLGDPMYRKGRVHSHEVYEIHESQSIYTSAWCFSREQWQRMQSHWNRPLKTQLGWDWSLSYTLWEQKWRALYPLVSRARNIGRVGVHSHPEFFDANIAPARYSDGAKAPAFYVTYKMDGEPQPQWITDELAATEDRYGHLRNR